MNLDMFTHAPRLAKLSLKFFLSILWQREITHPPGNIFSRIYAPNVRGGEVGVGGEMRNWPYVQERMSFCGKRALKG